jgi:hypothetical protein
MDHARTIPAIGRAEVCYRGAAVGRRCLGSLAYVIWMKLISGRARARRSIGEGEKTTTTISTRNSFGLWLAIGANIKSPNFFCRGSTFPSTESTEDGFHFFNVRCV